MPQFHRDTWVLDVYLDEAGWDGEHKQVYFSTRRDAALAGTLLARLFEGYNNGGGLDFNVYKADPYESFFDRQTELENIVKNLAIVWQRG